MIRIKNSFGIHGYVYKKAIMLVYAWKRETMP